MRIGRKQKYPWGRWFKLDEFTLERGVHYRISQSSMQQTIRNNASQRSISISIEDNGDKLVVKIIKDNKNENTYPDRTTLTSKQTVTLASDGTHKEESTTSNEVLSTRQDNTTSSTNSNNYPNRTKKTR